MFAIVLRLIADGAKANPDRGLDALPDVNKAMPLALEDNKWFVMNETAAPTVFAKLDLAQEEFKNVKNGIFTKEAEVKHVTGVIGDFAKKYSDRGLHHQAFIELQVLSPVKIDSDEVDLELF